ncbi:MAG TPA: adenosine kinase [Caulobacteraceae bacterium]|nr:adenosine kinase [Caulobacteraceae bacterium]
MVARYDVAAIGNAIVDVIAPADDAFLGREGLAKGAMTLIDEPRAEALYERMAQAVETSGGSAANTIAGVASLGARARYVGKVAGDALGEIFRHDIRAIGAHYDTAPLVEGPATARCLINVTPDGERTMCTYLGASVRLEPADVAEEDIAEAEILYLEGYLFDPESARAAFAKAAAIARGAGRRIALSLSDAFVVERHRADLLAFIDAEVDVLIANQGEAMALFRTPDLSATVEAVRGRVALAAVTRSAEGSIIIANGSSIAVKAAPSAKLVDTTGAGDQYAAGFLVGLARGRPLAECGALGSLAAAEVIDHFGPRPQRPLAALAMDQGLI